MECLVVGRLKDTDRMAISKVVLPKSTFRTPSNVLMVRWNMSLDRKTEEHRAANRGGWNEP